MDLTRSPGAEGHARLPVAGLANLAVIYVVWGSTYLAIRIAVRDGAGWGPFWLGAARVLVAAGLLFAINALRTTRLRPTRGELGVLAASGTLLWVGGNGAVNWAETRVDSGLAALVVGTTPIWVAMVEAALDRRPPSALLCGGLAVGFAGLLVLTSPTLRGGLGGQAAGVAAVVGATLSWGCGSILLRRRPVGLDPIVTSGWQQLIGGLGFTAVALLVGEPAPAPSPAAWAAWGYLVVFGSLIAFTSFVTALKLLPTTLVMTYAYVNPVIAVVLGRILLDEPVTGSTALGATLIMAGIYGVFRDQSRRPA